MAMTASPTARRSTLACRWRAPNRPSVNREWWPARESIGEIRWHLVIGCGAAAFRLQEEEAGDPAAASASANDQSAAAYNDSACNSADQHLIGGQNVKTDYDS